MIHMTSPDRVEAILAEGLRTGREPELTSDAVWTLGYYGTNPVFLATETSDFIAAVRERDWSGHATLEVDATELELVADLACLIDAGARHDEDGYLFWPTTRIPETMRPFVDHDGAIEIEFLLDPATDACKAAIRLTGTAASLADIPAERLSRTIVEAGLKP